MDSPFILVPLYIYPLQKAWDPLLEAARKHPKVQFTAVINPNSGPGSSALPDASYVAALRELSAVANIRPLGYVHCSYGKRPIGAVKAEIDLYRGWNSEFRLDGIFFDETPSDSAHVDYMAGLAHHTRDTWRNELSRAGTVIYNPGVVVERAYFQHADYVVAFEQSESHWTRYFADQGLAQIATEMRRKTVAIVHSCADKDDRIASLTRQARAFGLSGIYTTDQVGGGYTQWPNTFARQADVLAES